MLLAHSRGAPGACSHWERDLSCSRDDNAIASQHGSAVSWCAGRQAGGAQRFACRLARPPGEKHDHMELHTGTHAQAVDHPTCELSITGTDRPAAAGHHQHEAMQVEPSASEWSHLVPRPHHAGRQISAEHHGAHALARARPPGKLWGVCSPCRAVLYPSDILAMTCTCSVLTTCAHSCEENIIEARANEHASLHQANSVVCKCRCLLRTCDTCSRLLLQEEAACRQTCLCQYTLVLL